MKINNLKALIPELFLIISVIYYWTLTSSLFNPYAIGLLVILFYQIKSKKPVLGLVISTIVILLSLYMVLALISELSEFQNVTQNFKNLLIFGTLYIGCTLIMAGFMFFKYLKLKIN